MSVGIGLKWNGFESNILSKMKELYNDEDIADVTLQTDGHSFKAHKFILWANSSVFRTIFQQNPRKDSYYIALHGIKPEALKTLMTYMYNGEVNVTREFLSVVLRAAEVLKIFGLTERCFEDLEKSLDSTLENKNTADISENENLDNIYSLNQKGTKKSVSKIYFDEIQNKWISETGLKTCSNPECTGEKDDDDDDAVNSDVEDECCACKVQKRKGETNDSSSESKPKRKRAEEKPRALVRSNPDMLYIKQFPCLYDAGHVNYTSRRIVNQTTKELQNLLNSKSDKKYSYEDTKKLITVYRRFLMRQRRNSDPVEINPDEEYVKEFPCLYDSKDKYYTNRRVVRRTTYRLQALLNSKSEQRYTYEDTQDLIKSYRQSLMREQYIPPTSESSESIESSPPQSADVNEDSNLPENTNSNGSISNLEYSTPLPAAQISKLPVESASYGPQLEGSLHVVTQPHGITQPNIVVGPVAVNKFTPEDTVILSTGFQANTASDLNLVQIPSTPLSLEQVSELLIGPDSGAEKPALFPGKLAMSQPPPERTSEVNITIGLDNMLPDTAGLKGFNVGSEPTAQPEPDSPLTLAQISEFLTEPESSESGVQKDKIHVPTELPPIQSAEGDIMIRVNELLPEDTGLTGYEDDSSQCSQMQPSALTLEQISGFLIEPESCETDAMKDSLPVPIESPHTLAAQVEATEYLPENAQLTGYQGSYESPSSFQPETNASLTLTQLLEDLIEPASYESEAQKVTFPLPTELPLGQTAQATITIGLNEFVAQNTENIEPAEPDAESIQEPEPSTALTSEQISEFLIFTPRTDDSAT